MDYPNILSQNLYNDVFKGKFLLIGKCVPEMHPGVMEHFAQNWQNVVSICLEQFHYNQLVAKLFGILGTGNIKKVGFLTVDGSPHCVQVHYISKYLKRALNKEVEFEHYVIRKDGRVFAVGMENIDKSKNLSNVGKPVTISS